MFRLVALPFTSTLRSVPRFCPCNSSARLPALTRHLRLRCASSHSSPPNPTDNTQPEPLRTPEAQSTTNAEADRLAEMKEQLRGWTETASARLRERVDKFTADLASTFSQLGGELNRVTGYGEIEVLKKRVVEQEGRINAARQASRESKGAYDRAVLQRAASQREVNDLLQRKSTWTDEDVGRFTSLVRQDHLREQDESRAKASATQSEDAVEREFSELMRVILNRYHEEQAWSDKIRSASTYGSLAVLGVNMAVFILAILFVEPWKRRKLAQTFGRKVEQLSAESTALLESKTQQLSERLDGQDQMLAQIVETVYYSSQPAQVGQLAEDNPNIIPPQPQLKSTIVVNREFALAITTSAAAAGILGWLARSWFG
ncbi:Mdm33 family-domain-containing protein [Sparassis latifolia]